MPIAVHRRRLLQVTGTLVASAALAPGAAGATAAGKPPGLKLGLASYSMRKRSLDEVIDFARAQSLTHLSLKDVHLPLTASPAELQLARDKLTAAGIQLAGVGVVYMKTEAEVERAFRYARAAGAALIVAAPEPALLDVVEAAVKAHDLPLAIHNHGPADPHYPTPAKILALIRQRDRRLGVCLDVGNAASAGVDPVRWVALTGPRLLDVHLKDLSKDVAAPGQQGKATELGRGFIDVAGVLRQLAARRFAGHVAIEYEASPDDPRPGIRESLAYVRGVLAGLRASRST
jgi:inosose dehydratase